jgi:ATP-dependent DNA helicase PIF1
MSELVMTPELQGAWDCIGETNALITGRAGTGKSTLLKEYCWQNRCAVRLAPTGVAALNIGGQTIHSFFRFPFSVQPKEAARLSPKKPEVYQALTGLIIDEASMVRADLLDSIDSFLQVNGPCYGQPFGGVPVTFFGDPYQLPPVLRPEEEALLRDYESRFFFSAHAWTEDISTVELTKVFRQREGSAFLNVLDGIRDGSVVEDDLALFRDRVKPTLSLDDPYEADAMRLTTHVSQAARINNSMLAALPGTADTFRARTEGYFPQAENQLPTDSALALKPGARVMFLVNNMPTWVNGTIGTVERLYPPHAVSVRLPDGTVELVEKHAWERHAYEYNPVLDEVERSVVGSFEQLPLKLAWACTIHKSQGLTLHEATICLERDPFDSGQLYVALSRLRALEGLTLTRMIRKSDIIVDPLVRKFMGYRINAGGGLFGSGQLRGQV